MRQQRCALRRDHRKWRLLARARATTDINYLGHRDALAYDTPLRESRGRRRAPAANATRARDFRFSSCAFVCKFLHRAATAVLSPHPREDSLFFPLLPPPPPSLLRRSARARWRHRGIVASLNCWKNCAAAAAMRGTFLSRARRGENESVALAKYLCQQGSARPRDRAAPLSITERCVCVTMHARARARAKKEPVIHGR